MRFFNNFFSMLKGPSFSCGLVCLAAHLNSHDSNRNRIVFFRLGGLKRSLHTPSVSSAFWSSCLGLCSAGSWKPPRMESAQLSGQPCQCLIGVTVTSFFPLNQNVCMYLLLLILLLCTSVESVAAFFLIISGTGGKLLGSLSSLLTECSSLSLFSQGMCSHTNLTPLSCAHCNLSNSFS